VPIDNAQKIIYQGQEESVRLIGIDTTESKKNKKARKDAGRSGKDIEQITAMGKEAARYMRTIAREGDRVNIEFDVQKRDKYRRLLGYVYLENGRMLNEEIIKAGCAIPPM
jgi:micrococcal nuclease